MNNYANLLELDVKDFVENSKYTKGHWVINPTTKELKEIKPYQFNYYINKLKWLLYTSI